MGLEVVCSIQRTALCGNQKKQILVSELHLALWTQRCVTFIPTLFAAQATLCHSCRISLLEQVMQTSMPHHLL